MFKILFIKLSSSTKYFQTPIIYLDLLNQFLHYVLLVQCLVLQCTKLFQLSLTYTCNFLRLLLYEN